jgi:hypothetical protein
MSGYARPFFHVRICKTLLISPRSHFSVSP